MDMFKRFSVETDLIHLFIALDLNIINWKIPKAKLYLNDRNFISFHFINLFFLLFYFNFFFLLLNNLIYLEPKYNTEEGLRPQYTSYKFKIKIY